MNKSILEKVKCHFLLIKGNNLLNLDMAIIELTRMGKKQHEEVY